MSIAAATRSAYAVEVSSERSEYAQASGDEPTDSALKSIAEWIPSEVLGIYIALLGLFTPTGDGRWIIFLIGVALVPAMGLLNTAILNKQARELWQGEPGSAPQLGGRKLGIVLGLMLLSFITYAWALPTTPFTDWVSDATIYGAAAAIILAPFLPKIAQMAGVKPPVT